MARTSPVLLALLLTLFVASITQAAKRQYFDSLGGMALGKRVARSVDESDYDSFLRDPETKRLLLRYFNGGGRHKRPVLDALGGDYLFKKKRSV